MDNYYFMLDEMTKLCGEDVTRSDAVDALAKLRKLEKQKPTADQLTRGALAGGLVGIAARGTSGLASGEVLKGLKGGLSAPGGAKNKVVGVGKSLGRGLLNSAGASASGATFGAGLPVVRSILDREAEKDVLREYVGEGRGGRVRRASKKYLGV